MKLGQDGTGHHPLVTSPAPRSSLPPRITHSGATATSSANPENHSAANRAAGHAGHLPTEPGPGA